MRGDRPPSLRQLAQACHVEVAVGGQRHGARDRSGCHVQDVGGEPGRGGGPLAACQVVGLSFGAPLRVRARRVRAHVRVHVSARNRRAFAIQRRALAHPEAVLLIHDRHREAVELHVTLDQGVRADHQLQLPRGEPPQMLGAATPRRRAGQQRRREQRLGDERLQRREVLFGERLRRSHQRPLHPVLDRAQQRVQRDHSLARADLAHQQALHRARPRQVGVDRRHRPPTGRR